MAHTPIIARSEDSIYVRRFRDGGSKEYYLMPENKLIVSAIIQHSHDWDYVVTCHTSARATRVPYGHKGTGCIAAVEKYIFEATGIVFRPTSEGVVNV